jgi:hypothetical protein
VALVPLGNEATNLRALHRQTRHYRRKRRLQRLGVLACSVAMVVVAALVVSLLNRTTTGEAAADEAPEAPATTFLPPVPPTVLAEPVANTAPRQSPFEVWPVQLPGNQLADGWLITDGQPHYLPQGTIHAPRIVPGNVGQAVLTVPADLTSVQSFNLGGTSWWVIQRSQVDRSSGLDYLLRQNPIVPTVALVDDRPNPTPQVTVVIAR